MNSSSYLIVHEFPQITVLNLVLGGTIFTEGGHYSPVNNVRGDIFGGDTVHYDTGSKDHVNSSDSVPTSHYPSLD